VKGTEPAHKAYFAFMMNTQPSLCSVDGVTDAIASIPRGEDCCVTTHRNADGDAMGSALAVWHVLRGRGVNARVILPTPVPSNLAWLPGANSAEVFDATVHNSYLESVPNAVVVDLNTAARFAPVSDLLIRSSCYRIVVDHHVEPEMFAQCIHVNVESPATCAILVDVLKSLLPDGFSKEIAQCLYTGIYTDTGGFRFPRTNGSLFRAVGELVDAGADPVLTHEQLYNQTPRSRLVLLGKALASMQFYHQGATAVMALSQSDLTSHGATSEDLDGFVHHTLSIAGVDAGILIADLGQNVKISFRSKGEMYVRDIAASYGGGGHVYAAGARVEGLPLDDVVASVIERVGLYRDSARSMRSTP